MCLIIDANLTAQVFAATPNPNFVPVLDWLSSRDGLMVYGGKNYDELKRVGRAAIFIQQLARAGHALQFRKESIEAEEKVVAQFNLMRSDDPHVIALARISGARVVCTDDVALIDDFKNTRLVPSPKGKVYRRKNHQNVLGHSKGCRGYKKRKR